MTSPEGGKTLSIKTLLVGWVLSATVFPLANALLCEAVRGLPIFMDSVFTVFATACFGLLPGLLTALLSNVFIDAFHGFAGTDLPFGLCGAATALIVSAFVARPIRIKAEEASKGAGFLLNAAACTAAVTLANAVLGAIIATFVFGGRTGASIDNVASGFALVADSLFSAAFLARLPANLVDKSIAILAGFGAAALLRPRLAAQEGSKIPAR